MITIYLFTPITMLSQEAVELQLWDDTRAEQRYVSGSEIWLEVLLNWADQEKLEQSGKYRKFKKIKVLQLKK